MTLFFDLLGFLEHGGIIVAPDSFQLSPTSGSAALLESNLVYDGPWNLYVLSASSIFVIVDSFPFENTKRLAAIWPILTILPPVLANWLWLNSNYAVPNVGCYLPCTSSGMSGIAMASAGFSLSWTLMVLGHVIWKVWQNGTNSVKLGTRIGAMVMFVACLGWTMLVIFAAVIGQYPGVVFIHLLSFSTALIASGLALVVLSSTVLRQEWRTA